MSNQKLFWIWHVGSRSGYIPIGFPSQFDHAIGVFLIDGADVGVLRSVVLPDGREAFCRTEQLCVAVWDTDRSIELFHTACPFATSARRLDPKFAGWTLFGNGNCDYVLGEAHQVERIEVVRARSLDSLASERHSVIGMPSILSIDAQGASLPILLGASMVLDQHVDAIICETELIPFYGGTPSFSGTLEMLSAKGFLFSGFIEEATSWASPCRTPVGTRSRTLQGSLDAMFIRDPQQLPESLDPARATRYVIAACLLGHADIAAAALMRVKEDFPESNDPTIVFARQLRDAVLEMPARFPPSFKEARLAKQRDERQSPALMERDIIDTPFESCLREAGFTSLANQVRQFRTDQSAFATS